MKSIIFRLLINAIAVYVAAYILPGVGVDTYTTTVVVAIVLGIVNTFIKPVVHILSLPISILTLGVFALVINGTLILLVDALVPGFTVNGFWWALAFSFVVSIVSAFLNTLKK